MFAGFFILAIRSLTVELLDQAVKSSDSPFDFRRIMPPPSIVDEMATAFISSEMLRDHPGRNVRDWQIEHWGTKWNAYEFTDCKPGSYTFCTAWAAPISVITELSNLFPELKITLWHQEECEDESDHITFGPDQE